MFLHTSIVCFSLIMANFLMKVQGISLKKNLDSKSRRKSSPKFTLVVEKLYLVPGIYIGHTIYYLIVK